MDKRIARLFEINTRMTQIHIGVKTVDNLFHKATEAFYLKTFDVVHQIAEKRQDVKADKPMDCEIAEQEAYDLLEETKDILKELIDENTTIWEDNLLRGLYDEVEFECGNARSFIDDEEEPKLPIKEIIKLK